MRRFGTEAVISFWKRTARVDEYRSQHDWGLVKHDCTSESLFGCIPSPSISSQSYGQLHVKLETEASQLAIWRSLSDFAELP